MRRLVILATLSLLLLAAAGVTFAGERTFGPGPEDQTESTAPESTTPEPTSVEITAPETTQPENTVPKPDDTGKPDRGKPEEGSHVVKKPKHPGVKMPAHPGAGRPEDRGQAPGIDRPRCPEKHEAAPRPPEMGKPCEVGRPDDRGGQIGPEHGFGGPEHAGKPPFGPPHEPKERSEHGGGQEKVTICHKDKVTITVGEPARDAHMRHGDSEGPCSGPTSGSPQPETR